MDFEPTNLQGKTVLVTGGGQGIGATLVEAFALAGARVVAADIQEPAVSALAARLSGQGLEVSGAALDVTQERQVLELSRDLQQSHGGVDVLVNNAALFSTLKMQPFDEIELEVWDKVLKVNLTGPFLCAKHFAPIMREKGGGRIINIASGAVTLGRPNYLHYIASKAGLVGMSRSMARELGPHSVTVNAVLPGSVDTGIERETVTPEAKSRIVAMQCIPRGQVPQDLVGVMLFLASDSSGFITGQSITVDGGATHS
ncbi:SDR family NAD(P)-dependent oxidoreductase [Pusillimonas sp.]|uniref:SDR family NAD(P)-dependent oxidoreductase n=1 Tax=Pusillimonas sp. TaxID=3040095 RepID=UPI0037C798C4